MTDLQECRRKIDEIDNQMVELFEKRMKVCEEVAEYKIHTGKKVLDPEREHAKLEEIQEKSPRRVQRAWRPGAFSADHGHQQKASVPASHRVWSEGRGRLPNGGAASQKQCDRGFPGVEGAYSYGAMRRLLSGELRAIT
ncbi:MAG: chorismate mutase [Ruminococcus sp.]